MNNLSKALALSFVVISAAAYGFWDSTDNSRVSNHDADVPVSVATSGDGKIIYVGRAGRVFKSTDGGETWKVLL
jgi:photosystem II stability/assembly factor-like uncharacterized protein